MTEEEGRAVMVPVCCGSSHADEDERGAAGCSETSVAQDKWLGRKATRLPSHKSAKRQVSDSARSVCSVQSHQDPLTGTSLDSDKLAKYSEWPKKIDQANAVRHTVLWEQWV